MFKEFGPGSEYDNEMTKLYRPNMQDKSMYPVTGKWQDFIMRRFSECYGRGMKLEDLDEDDTNVDPDCIIMNIPLVALLAGKPRLMEILRESTLQMQVNDMMVSVVMMASRLIERYILDSASAGNTEATSSSSSSSTQQQQQQQQQPCHPVQQVMRDLKKPDRACADALDLAMVSHLNKVLDCKDLSHEDASIKFGVS